jgi:hypothetical protein
MGLIKANNFANDYWFVFVTDSEEDNEREEGLPEGWDIAVDPGTDKRYFWHRDTKKATWNRPTTSTPIN